MDCTFEPQTTAHNTHPAMGTIMTHKAFGWNADETLLAVEMEIQRLEALFSRFLPASDVSSINQAAGLHAVPVSPETLLVLRTAQDFATRHVGTLDITITPLVELWREAAATGNPPVPASIQQALTLVHAEDLLINNDNGTAMLARTGQCLDLGGIAKGYAANRMLDVFHAFNMQSAYSNLGGNVIALGAKPDGSAWKIGIQHPRRQQALLGAVSIENQAVVTSGDYQRYFIGKDGRRYHHILDPRTGYPSQSDLISVTIIGSDAMLADALSTAVFIAGLQKGLDLISRYPECEAILVDKDLNGVITKGLGDKFQCENGIRMAIVEP